ncbi:MAG: hypothetical protein K2L88_05770 [Clostridiales bacterium]|nr:hypothetical protein [Clostridiales bacterium]
MTNVSRKCVWTLVLGSLAVATLIFFAWATSGFVNWNASSWFDYWGKGKPSVVRVVELPAEQSVVALTSAQSSSNNLFYDSDDATITAEVKRGLALSLEVAPDGLYVVGTSKEANDWGSKINVEVRQKKAGSFGSGTLLGSFEKTITASTRVGEKLHYLIPYSEFNSCIKDIAANTEFFIRVINLAHGDYLASNGDSVYFAKPEGTFNPYLTGTDIFVPYGSISYDNFRLDCDFNPSLPLSASVIVRDYDGYIIHLAEIPFLEEQIDNVVLTLTAKYTGSVSVPYFGFYYEFKLHIAKLSAPTNVTYKAGVLSWNAVPGAMGYAVFDGDTLCSDTLTETQYNFADEELSAGEHVFRVRALGNVGKAIADNKMSAMRLSAYNASSTITQLVALTTFVGDDSTIQLVPYGDNILDHCRDVNVPGKEFGGWYYDDGYYRSVKSTDILEGDITIYGRLSDKKIVEKKVTWWDNYQWYVYGGLIAFAVIIIASGVVVTIRKKKTA